MPIPGPEGCAHRAERRPRGRPVASHAPRDPTTARRISRGCRSIRRAMPCSCAAPTSRLPSSTTRWRSLPSSPSRGSIATRWRSSPTRPRSSRWPPGNSPAAAGARRAAPPAGMRVLAPGRGGDYRGPGHRGNSLPCGCFGVSAIRVVLLALMPSFLSVWLVGRMGISVSLGLVPRLFPNPRDGAAMGQAQQGGRQGHGVARCRSEARAPPLD